MSCFGKVTRPGAWEDIAKFVEDSGSNSFVRNLIRALTTLYDLDEDGWRRDVLDRAGIDRIITDPFKNPLLNAHQELGERYCSVLRINALAFGWHEESCDHNGNSGHQFARHIGHRLDTFDDYLALLERLMDTMRERHQIALKNALAYDRSVDFDDVDEDLAGRAWGQRNPTAAQRKAFGHVIVDRLGRLDLGWCKHAGGEKEREETFHTPAQVRVHRWLAT